MTQTPEGTPSEGATGGGEGIQTDFETAPSTYPSSWKESGADGPYPMPGTVTQAPSPEHANATEQQYYLQDSDTPVQKGDHVRPDLS
jgi:hypothetical protein